MKKLFPEDVETVVEWIGRAVNVASELPGSDAFLADVRVFVLSHPDVTPKMKRVFELAVKVGMK